MLVDKTAFGILGVHKVKENPTKYKIQLKVYSAGKNPKILHITISSSVVSNFWNMSSRTSGFIFLQNRDGA